LKVPKSYPEIFSLLALDSLDQTQKNQEGKCFDFDIRFFGLLGGALWLHLLTFSLLESFQKIPKKIFPFSLRLLRQNPEKHKMESLLL